MGTMRDDEVECPHCHAIQSDCTNGGDPGAWWYASDGEILDVECDECGKTFGLEVQLDPRFDSYKLEEDPNDDQ